MSTGAWIILLILLVPIIGILIWVIVAASVVRVPSGSLGLLMVKGKATDTTLPPGSHFIFAFRRRIVEEYPPSNWPTGLVPGTPPTLTRPVVNHAAHRSWSSPVRR